MLALHKQLTTATQLTIRARIFFDLWWQTAGADTRPNHINEMRRHSEFFRYSEHAYFFAFITQIYVLFDNRRDTISFRNLLKTIKKKPGLDTSGVESELERTCAISEKVKILRHNAFAHRSNSMNYNDAFREAGLSPDELRALTDLSLSIANKLLALENLPEQFFTDLPQADFENLLSDLKQLP